MSFQFVIQREGQKLVPASVLDLEMLDRMPVALPVMGKFWQPRSLPHQRWYRGLLALVCQATDRWSSPQNLHLWLKIRAGMIEQVIEESGHTYHVLESTAFDAMDEIRFKAYTEQALNILFDSGALHQSTKKHVLAEISKMTGVAL